MGKGKKGNIQEAQPTGFSFMKANVHKSISVHQRLLAVPVMECNLSRGAYV